jgi:hypothetical protein
MPNAALVALRHAQPRRCLIQRCHSIAKLPGEGAIGSPQDVENGAVSLSLLLQMLEESAAASVVILDTHFPLVTVGDSKLP